MEHKNIKVLWLGIDREERVAKHFIDLRNSFSEIADITVLNHGICTKTPSIDSLDLMVNGDGREKILQSHLIDNNYDFIICDAPFAFNHEDWGLIDTPKAVIIEDQHNESPKIQVDFAVDNNFIILHRYKFNKYHTKLPKHIKTIWFPHSVNTDVFKDYSLDKEYGVLLTGAMYMVYQTRHRLNKLFDDQKWFSRLVRPKEIDKVKWPAGGDYAKELNKSIMAVCCGSTHQYPVMKYFEIPASKSIVYGDWFSELGDLGFMPGINMIVAEDDAIGQVNELLKNPDGLDKISQSGFNLINSRHTNTIRAKELLDIIKENK